MKISRCIALTLIAAVGVWVRLPAQTPSGQAAGPVKAFTGARLIDGTTAAPIDNATLLVSNGRLVSVGPAARVTIPANATRTSLAGKTVIPGLINAHGHVGDTAGLTAGRYSADQVMKDLRTYAVHGVTTVVSLGGDAAPSFAARDSQQTAALDRARIWAAGPVIAPRSAEEARKLVADAAAMKVDIVKIRVDDNLGTTQKMAPDIYRAVIDEAHKRSLRVAAHLFYLADAKSLLDAGADFIAHSVRDAEVDAPLIAALKKRDVCVSPTLMREVSTFVYESVPPFFSDPLFLKYADPASVATLKEPARQQAMKSSTSAQRYKAALDVASRNLKKLADEGVTIAMGTDTGPPARFQGYFELMELELMAKAGLTPRQVLAAATRDAARCMKIDREVGTLETGKWADFVALDADPMADITNTKKISDVYIAGNRVNR
jgi:imidazolonepropionase-like amidohydrolase